MATELRYSKLLDLCTNSIGYDYQVQSGCEAFDRQMYEIIDETGQVIFIPNIMGLTDSKLVDILAWQFNVDGYDTTRDLEFRKTLVQKSIEWHKRKGTVDLVNEVINTYWPGGGTLEEWYEYKTPYPPNYPIDDIGAHVGPTPSFPPANVNISTDTITVNAHGLVLNDQIRIEPYFSPTLPTTPMPQPLLRGIYYFVTAPTTNTFKLSPGLNGSAINLLTQGIGQGFEIYKKGTGSWHDRYRFRIMVDQAAIPAGDELKVLELIMRYKPVSRWLEGIFYQTVSVCDIGWCGGSLQFVYLTSEKPTNYP